MPNNKFIKTLGQKEPLLTAKHIHTSGPWVHGIMAREKAWDHNFPLHSHEFYELEYVQSGSMSTVIDGVEFHMNPGDFYVLGPTDYHSLIVPASGVVLLGLFFYHPAVDSEVVRFLESNPCPVIGTIPEKDRAAFEGLIRQIYENENQPLTGQLDSITMASLLAMHIVYRANPNSPDGGVRMDGYLQNAFHYILAHFNEPLTLKEVANAVGLSSGYFCRLFSEQTGGPFHDYLARVRIRKAQNMLLYETKKSVTDIAFEVGFGSYSNFYRTFMRITGISPRDYQSRESLLRENEE